MNFEQSVEYLYSFVNHERTGVFSYDTRTLDLVAFEELLHRLGDPHRAFATVHVAGTKGKGSTCAMIASVLRRSGLRVGLFTSPHLVEIRERIQVDGRKIPRRLFASVLSDIRPVHTKLGSQQRSYRTTFELLTACAFMHFAREAVQVAVIETGLGGRLDATNVVRPEVCVITRVGYDHTRVLGELVEQIAREKAGIMKERTPVVIAPQRPEVHSVLLETASALGCRVVDVGSDFRWRCETACPSHQVISVQGPEVSLDRIRLPLLGDHQAENAVCAISAARLLSKQFGSITAGSIRRGLAAVRWYGRVEVVHTKPPVIVDCAHNEDSAEALVATLSSLFSPTRRIAVVGVSTNKEAARLLSVLSGYFDEFYVTKADTVRAMPPGVLAEMLLGLGAKARVFNEAAQAARAALARIGDDTLVCVTGSVYLAGELRQILVEWSRANRER